MYRQYGVWGLGLDGRLVNTRSTVPNMFGEVGLEYSNGSLLRIMSQYKSLGYMGSSQN